MRWVNKLKKVKFLTKLSRNVVTKNQKKSNYQSKRNKSIREHLPIKVKLVLSHMLIAIIPILIIATATLGQARDAIIDGIQDSSAELINRESNAISSRLQEVEKTSMMLISDTTFIKTLNKSSSDYDNLYEMLKERDLNINNQLNSIRFANPHITNTLVIKSNELIDPIGTSRIFTDEFRVSFFKSEIYEKVKAKKGGTVWFSHLYDNPKSIYLMKQIRSMSTGTEIGVLILEVDKKHIDKVGKNNAVHKDSQVSIIDEQGLIISHTDESLIGTQYSQLDTIINHRESNQDSNNGYYVNRKIMTAYSEIANGWSIVLEVPTRSFLESAETIKRFTYIVSIIIAFLVIAIAIFITNNITKPIKHIKNKMKEIEEGDLTIRSSIIGKYEMGQLSHSFNSMADRINALINNTKKLTLAVADNSNTVSEIAQNSAAGSREVMIAVESISTGAMEQASDAEKASYTVKELVGKVNETEASFNHVIQATNKTKEAIKEAMTIMGELNHSTKETTHLSDTIKKDIMNLLGQFSKVLNSISIIDEISEQTNLLSLNAAIEAARAGEAGKGFSVVADEVGKLAVQSKDAAKNISEIINNVHQITNKTSKLLDDSSQIYERQENAVIKTDSTFQGVESNMDSINQEVNNVYAMLNQLSDIEDKATDSITSIASIAEESAAAIEEVLATGEEQTTSAEKMVSMSEQLISMIDEMNQSLEHFKIHPTQE